MTSELWEVVKVAALKPGDEIRFPDGERYIWTDDDVQAIERYSDHYPDKLRRYTGPPVDALMLALKDVHELAVAYAGIDAVGPLDGRIREAIRELESEAGDAS